MPDCHCALPAIWLPQRLYRHSNRPHGNMASGAFQLTSIAMTAAINSFAQMVQAADARRQALQPTKQPPVPASSDSRRYPGLAY